MIDNGFLLSYVLLTAQTKRNALKSFGNFGFAPGEYAWDLCNRSYLNLLQNEKCP